MVQQASRAARECTHFKKERSSMSTDHKSITINEHEAALLNELIQLDLDGESGYQSAADDLHNKTYVALLQSYAQERARLAAALRTLLREQGYQPEDEGTLAGAFHQGWMNLKSALLEGDAPILAACEEADQLALSAYQDVMSKTTNGPLLEILREQHATIKVAYERVKALRSALEQSVES